MKQSRILALILGNQIISKFCQSKLKELSFLLFVYDLCFINVICVCLRIVVSNNVVTL